MFKGAIDGRISLFLLFSYFRSVVKNIELRDVGGDRLYHSGFLMTSQTLLPSYEPVYNISLLLCVLYSECQNESKLTLMCFSHSVSPLNDLQNL